MLQNSPLVSVIALCYNHEKFLDECLQSVVNQTYSPIELIIVDDYSKDNSRLKILDFCKKKIQVQYIFNDKNIGNCASFNFGFKLAKGKYIIDLSTDDVLKPNRVKEQVEKFEESENIGVVTSDAEYIDEKSNYLGNFYQKNLLLKSEKMYESLLKSSFILPSTMMIRKSVLDELGGYDEKLAYEDFDFWVRSSRLFTYAHVPKILVQQRIIAGSHATSFTLKKNKLIASTVTVCQKALLLNETQSENQALVQRLKVVLRKCVYTENFESGKSVILMLNQLNGQTLQTRIFQFLNTIQLPLNRFYLKYIEFRAYVRFK
jgi:glycosyltransferase involved in cell wall biosynthesis